MQIITDSKVMNFFRIFIIISFFIPRLAYSQDTSTAMFGLALSRCSDFLELTSPKKDPSGYIKSAYSSVSDGLLSGFSVMTTIVKHQTTATGLTTEQNERFSWLTERCRKDPTEGFTNANLALWNFMKAHGI